MKPLLYVDVDGVLNCFGYRARRDYAYERVFQATETGQGNTYLIQVPAGTRARIELLQEQFEPVWATTWEQDAVDVLAPELGFGSDWPVLLIEPRAAHPLVVPGRMSDPYTKKLCSLLGHAGDRPMAWVDDDVQADTIRAFELRERTVAPTLLITPKAHLGLNDGHLHRLLRFAAAIERLSADAT